MQTASEAPAIEFSSVSKRYRLHEEMTIIEFLPSVFRRKHADASHFFALKDVSFTVPRGQVLGIIGKNGSGKSTILKLMAGVTGPTAGRVVVRGRVSPLIELAAGFHPDLTGRENVFLNASILGLTNSETKNLFNAIVEFAGVQAFIDTPVKHYSSGMYMRLGFSVAAHSNPDILLIDEILAVGDAEFQAKCMDRMAEFQRQGTTMVLVTHSADLAREFCERVILVDRGICVADGNPAEVVAAYQSRASSAALIP